MSFSRQIFTLFHELYHLISNTSGVEIIRDDYLNFLRGNNQRIEKRCDEFANAFLVPLDDFVIELEKEALSPVRIEELANLYSVSREAIMYKLLQMRRITSGEYSALKEEFYSEDNGIPVPDYIDTNVSDKVVCIIQSYVGVVNKMVWRKY